MDYGIVRPPRLRGLRRRISHLPRRKAEIFDEESSGRWSDSSHLPSIDIADPYTTFKKEQPRWEEEEESVDYQDDCIEYHDDNASASTSQSFQGRCRRRTSKRAPQEPIKGGQEEESSPHTRSESKSRKQIPEAVKPGKKDEVVNIPKTKNQDNAQRRAEKDDPWQAAKRGDLVALKKFQIQGDIDWTAEDESKHIPLYYACHSGANYNVMVVPFLLWATDLGDDETMVLGKCRKKCRNKQAKAILKAYQKGGLAAVGMGKRKKTSVLRKPQYRTDNQSAGEVSHSKTSLGFPSDFDRSRDLRATTKVDIRNDELDTISMTLSQLRDQNLPIKVEPSKKKEKDEIESFSHGTESNVTTQIQEPSMFASGLSIIQRLQNVPGHDSKSSKISGQDPAKNRNPDEDSRDLNKPIERNCNRRQPMIDRSTKPSDESEDDTWSLSSLLSLKRFQYKNRMLEDDSLSNKFSSIFFKPDGDSPARYTRSHRKGEMNRVESYVDYDEVGKTWTLGNHRKDDGKGQDRMVHVSDSRQRVRILDCDGVNVHIHGRKMAAILIEQCSNINVIFDSTISTCDVTSCSNIGLQVTGLCPTISCNNTDGVMVWLTREGMNESNFITNKSSNISISVPQKDDLHPWDRKEVPLPGQYVHRFQEGGRMVSHFTGQP